MKTLVRLLSTVAFVGAFALPALAADGADGSLVGGADLGSLVGHNVEAARDAQIIGKIDAVLATRDGRIGAVIMHSRNREVALAWNQLRFTDHGRKISVTLTKDEVRALPNYKYQEAALEDSVTTKAPIVSGQKTQAATSVNHAAMPAARLSSNTKAASDNTKTAAAASPPAAKTAASKTTASKTMASASSTTANAADHPADHRVADTTTGPLVGHGVENVGGQRIGEIDNVALDSHGKVSSVIVGVGGFLGVGKRDVALSWNTLKISDNARKISVDMTKDQIKALPAVQSNAQSTSTSSEKHMVVGSLGS